MNPSTKAPSGANDTLARAIDYLGAVEVAPERYAIKHEGRWFVVSQTTLLDYERFDTDGSLPPGDKTATWLDDSDYAEMRPWWSPEHRFAIQSLSADGEGFPCEPREVSRERYFASKEEAEAFLAEDPDAASTFDCRVITASLDTGEEVTV